MYSLSDKTHCIWNTHNLVVSWFTCSEWGNIHEPSLKCSFCSITIICICGFQLYWKSSHTAYWWEGYKDFPTHHRLHLPSISIIWLVLTHFLAVLNIFLGRERQSYGSVILLSFYLKEYDACTLLSHINYYLS